MSKPLKPGTPAPDSGIYKTVGPRGGNTGENVTAVKGHKLPPTPKPGEGYVIKQKTNR